MHLQASFAARLFIAPPEGEEVATFALRTALEDWLAQRHDDFSFDDVADGVLQQSVARVTVPRIIAVSRLLQQLGCTRHLVRAHGRGAAFLWQPPRRAH